MFRLLQGFGIWGAIKSDLCHLTSAACMSQPLQDCLHNCKELIVCIFIPWMPVFYVWMSTPWRNVSSSLARDLAHSGTCLVSSWLRAHCRLGTLWVRTQLRSLVFYLHIILSPWASHFILGTQFLYLWVGGVKEFIPHSGCGVQTRY